MSTRFFLKYSGDHSYLHSFPTRRSSDLKRPDCLRDWFIASPPAQPWRIARPSPTSRPPACAGSPRSRRGDRKHTSELQSRRDLVCRLLLEIKKISTLFLNSLFYEISS